MKVIAETHTESDNSGGDVLVQMTRHELGVITSLKHTPLNVSGYSYPIPPEEYSLAWLEHSLKELDKPQHLKRAIAAVTPKRKHK